MLETNVILYINSTSKKIKNQIKSNDYKIVINHCNKYILLPVFLGKQLNVPMVSGRLSTQWLHFCHCAIKIKSNLREKIRKCLYIKWNSNRIDHSGIIFIFVPISHPHPPPSHTHRGSPCTPVPGGPPLDGEVPVLPDKASCKLWSEIFSD